MVEWHTRQTKDLVPQGVRVQVPPWTSLHVAQLDRAQRYERWGWGFKSLREGMQLTGKVVHLNVSSDSKSARKAVMLETDEHEGAWYLRRKGGNAFQDPQLDALVGQTLTFEGELHGNTFIVSSWA